LPPSLLLASPSSQRTALRAGNPGRDTWEQSHPSAALTQQPGSTAGKSDTV